MSADCLLTKREAPHPRHELAGPGGNKSGTVCRGLPSTDQSWCDINSHSACSGYTEDEADPESCFCPCHNT